MERRPGGAMLPILVMGTARVMRGSDSNASPELRALQDIATDAASLRGRREHPRRRLPDLYGLVSEMSRQAVVINRPVRQRAISSGVPEPRSSAICGLAQLAAPVVPGGPSSTVGTYSNSWSPPSKVRLSTRSSLMSGYPS